MQVHGMQVPRGALDMRTLARTDSSIGAIAVLLLREPGESVAVSVTHCVHNSASFGAPNRWTHYACALSTSHCAAVGVLNGGDRLQARPYDLPCVQIRK